MHYLAWREVHLSDADRIAQFPLHDAQMDTSPESSNGWLPLHAACIWNQHTVIRAHIVRSGGAREE
jgi:hypothetical protein